MTSIHLCSLTVFTLRCFCMHILSWSYKWEIKLMDFHCNSGIRLFIVPSCELRVTNTATTFEDLMRSFIIKFVLVLIVLGDLSNSVSITWQLKFCCVKQPVTWFMKLCGVSSAPLFMTLSDIVFTNYELPYCIESQYGRFIRATQTKDISHELVVELHLEMWDFALLKDLKILLFMDFFLI